MTAASRGWLDVLLPPQADDRAIPASVCNVAAQLLAAEQGIDAHPAFARAHLADGFRLALRAARLSPDQLPASGAATIVVTIEEASASERVELFGRACGLCAREYELLGLLATGRDTRSMARGMSLSEHTIQDHLKSVFAKTGAYDRVTVLSRAWDQARDTQLSPLPGAGPAACAGPASWSAGEMVNRHDIRRSGINPGLVQDRHEHRSVFFEGLL